MQTYLRENPLLDVPIFKIIVISVVPFPSYVVNVCV